MKVLYYDKENIDIETVANMAQAIHDNLDEDFICLPKGMKLEDFTLEQMISLRDSLNKEIDKITKVVKDFM